MQENKQKSFGFWAPLIFLGVLATFPARVLAAPDLSIDGYSMGFGSAEPNLEYRLYEGNNPSFSLNFLNNGDENAGQSTGVLRIDIGDNGTWDVEKNIPVGTISAGGRVAVSVFDVWNAQAGPWGLQICADMKNAVAELDERNNCTEQHGDRVVPRPTNTPNLFVPFSYMIGPLEEGQLVGVGAVIRNTGLVSSPTAMVQLRVDVGNDGTWDVVAKPQQVSMIASREDAGVEWRGLWRAKNGFSQYEICVDPENSISESDENNNCTRGSFYVGMPAVPTTPHMLDITFIADGYTDFEAFHRDVELYKNYLLSRTPFNEFADKILFHTYDAKGSIPCRWQKTQPTYCSENVECYIREGSRMLTEAGLPYDKFVFVLNIASSSEIVPAVTFQQAGGDMASFINANKDRGAKVFVHELAHTFGLRDEYFSVGNLASTTDTCDGNCCQSSKCVDWNGISGASCIPGCARFENWYRSSEDSTMFHSENETFNEVSLRILRKNIEKYIDQTPPKVDIESPLNGSEIPYKFTDARIRFTNPNSIKKIELLIDGEIHGYMQGPFAQVTDWLPRLNVLMFQPGSSHTILAKAYDLSGNIGVSDPVTFTVGQKPSSISVNQSNLSPVHVPPLITQTEMITTSTSSMITPQQSSIYPETSVFPSSASTSVNASAPIVATTITFPRSLKKGSVGSDVARLQSYLARMSDIYPDGLVTGYFGPLTEVAVKRFQAKYGIVYSGDPSTTGYGLVGPRTRAKLNELLK